MAKSRKSKPNLSTEQIAQLEQTVLTTLEPLIPSEYYLVGTDLVREGGLWFLRVYLDGRDFWISVDNCADLTPAISEAVDSIDALEALGPFNLEVSSPGLFRELSRPREFAFYQGRRVQLKAKSGKGHFLPVTEGLVESFDDTTQTLTLSTEDGDTSATHAICLTDGPGVMVTLHPEIREQSESESVESSAESSIEINP